MFPPAIRQPRSRVLAAVVAATLIGVTVGVWTSAILRSPEWFHDSLAVDFGIYQAALDRWLSDGTWYLDRQLHGPYPIQLGDVLYPPVLIVLLAPFRFLGAILWVLVPMAILFWVVWRWRPNVYALCAIAVCIAWPYTPAKYLFGNPVIWAAAAVGLGTIWRWPAALALLKPTVLPFALIGIRDRRWWSTVVFLLVASIPFFADTLLYPQVLLDAQPNPIDGRGRPFYSLTEFPLLAIPILAWVGRRRHPG